MQKNFHKFGYDIIEHNVSSEDYSVTDSNKLKHIDMRNIRGHILVYYYYILNNECRLV